MLLSRVLARMRNELIPFTRTSCVWPPDTRSVRNGNGGGVGSVNSGVRAWACYGLEDGLGRYAGPTM